jgi:hypothetical protein
LFFFCGSFFAFEGETLSTGTGNVVRRSGVFAQSTVLIDIEGPSVSSALSPIGGVHVGARALVDRVLIWFGNIARLSQWGVGGVFSSFK